ncbi:Type I restriction-modification system, DNA-methyltransferase subunit M (EC [Olavius sp. associated proteobacterium Delta 1]|nr:Type I restriction-modification system, DNA-methyltransferase subunit M (EC [Olavius sp. associated proteobacterium Delta 1]
MLTLPSNMFYTVTLPATLWFFDRAKQDDRILFIDTRNIFNQIDRAHREFSDEQIQNIAIISHLHKGKKEKFIKLIDRYFEQGMEKLLESKIQVKSISEQLLEVLDGNDSKDTVFDLVKQWSDLKKLRTRHGEYLKKKGKQASIEQINKAQHALRGDIEPFYDGLHQCLKRLDKTVRRHEKQLAEKAQKKGKRNATDKQTRELKTALEALHAEVKNAENFYKHIQWLQERFPLAKYEDVTGLCKSATPQEVREQDYSLNPGRYVGVVIEEDGKTEEEFVEELLAMNQELGSLNREARKLEKIIHRNVLKLTGEE